MANVLSPDGFLAQDNYVALRLCMGGIVLVPPCNSKSGTMTSLWNTATRCSFRTDLAKDFLPSFCCRSPAPMKVWPRVT